MGRAHGALKGCVRRMLVRPSALPRRPTAVPPPSHRRPTAAPSLPHGSDHPLLPLPSAARAAGHAGRAAARAARAAAVPGCAVPGCAPGCAVPAARCRAALPRRALRASHAARTSSRCGNLAPDRGTSQPIGGVRGALEGGARCTTGWLVCQQSSRAQPHRRTAPATAAAPLAHPRSPSSASGACVALGRGTQPGFASVRPPRTRTGHLAPHRWGARCPRGVRGALPGWLVCPTELSRAAVPRPAVPTPLPHCRCRIAAAALPLPHCRCRTAAAALPLPHCRCRTAAAALPPLEPLVAHVSGPVLARDRAAYAARTSSRRHHRAPQRGTSHPIGGVRGALKGCAVGDGCCATSAPPAPPRRSGPSLPTPRRCSRRGAPRRAGHRPRRTPTGHRAPVGGVRGALKGCEVAAGAGVPTSAPPYRRRAAIPRRRAAIPPPRRRAASAAIAAPP